MYVLPIGFVTLNYYYYFMDNPGESIQRFQYLALKVYFWDQELYVPSEGRYSLMIQLRYSIPYVSQDQEFDL